MLLSFQRLDNATHRLTVQRPGDVDLVCELETRSTLLHDLIHYALEGEALQRPEPSCLRRGFWDALARGASYEDLVLEAVPGKESELMRVERLVGPFQGVWQGSLAIDEYLSFARQEEAWLDGAFVERAKERLRKLWGHWKATPFQEALELPWPPQAQDKVEQA